MLKATGRGRANWSTKNFDNFSMSQIAFRLFPVGTDSLMSYGDRILLFVFLLVPGAI